MTLTVKKGEISNLNESVRSFGQNGNYRSWHSVSFRLNNQAAMMKSDTHNNFSNGDKVTAVGQSKKSGFVIHAMRNETTGAWHAPNTIVPVLMSICLIVIGLPLSFLLIGIPPLFYGCYTLYQVYVVEQAKKMLRAS